MLLFSNFSRTETLHPRKEKHDWLENQAFEDGPRGQTPTRNQFPKLEYVYLRLQKLTPRCLWVDVSPIENGDFLSDADGGSYPSVGRENTLDCWIVWKIKNNCDDNKIKDWKPPSDFMIWYFFRKYSYIIEICNIFHISRMHLFFFYRGRRCHTFCRTPMMWTSPLPMIPVQSWRLWILGSRNSTSADVGCMTF